MLAPHLPETEQRTAVLAEALAIARTIRGEADRVRALEVLAPHLPEGLLAEALAVAHTIGGEADRVRVLGVLAPYLPEGLLAEALVAARAIRDEVDRVRALGMLAPNLGEQLSAGALRDLLRIAGGLRRSELLRLFQLFEPTLARLGGVETIRELCRAIRDTASWYP
jgi:hypothetical protein